MNRARRSFGVVIVAVLIAGCGSLFPNPGVRPPDGMDYTLHVFNGTTLAVDVVVNGQSIGVAAAEDGLELAPANLPGLPWNIEARTVAGRALLDLDVAPGSVIDIRNTDGSGMHSAPQARIALSCGELEIRIGALTPGGGPDRGQGVPGDCNP
jgi:hypothetical protein